MEQERCPRASEGTPSKRTRTKRKAIRTDGPDGVASWIVAFAAFVINFIMAGLSRMSGILYVAFIEMFHVDRKSASMPFSVRSSTMNLLGPVVGILGQKYGVRKVSVIGGVLGTMSAAACYFADDITWITIIWGGVNGVGTAMVTTLTTVVVGQYFDKYQTTASGMSFSGACVGSFIFPPLMEELLHVYGLGGSFLIIAGITMHVIPAAMILRKPIWVKRARNLLKDIESSVEGKDEKNSKPYTKEDEHSGVDLNYLRTNGDVVFKLLTTDVIDKGGQKLIPPYPSKEEILREMEDVYCFIGKKPISLVVSDVPPKLKMKFEGETSPVSKGQIQPTRTSLGEGIHSPLQKSKSVAKTQIDEARTSLGDDLHSPVRKTKSFVGSNRIAQCKPFILSKLNELYNKSENQIVSSNEKSLYSKGFKELRKLYKVYEAVKKRNIFSHSRRTTNPPHKMVPKVLIQDNKGKSTESSGVWTNIKASVLLHTNPMFLLIAFCRAIHFSTFIPAVTIIVDYVMDKGLVEEDGKYVIVTLSVGDLLGRLCFGWVTDRGLISLPRYMMIVMVIQGIFTASLPNMNTMETILPTTVMYALLQGSVFVRHSVLISKYMKSDEQPIAMGCVNFFAGVLGFAVPSYVGLFRDTMGSYDSIFYLNGVVGAFGGLLWMFEPFFSRQSLEHPDEESKNEEKV